MRKSHGVTLLGMVSFFIVLGILVYLIGPRLVGVPYKDKIEAVKRDLVAINDSLSQYKYDNGTYPTTEQGLEALVTEPTISPVPEFWRAGGYIDALPVDPWGQAYQYQNNEGVIRVYSYGSRGKDRGTELDMSNIDSQ